MKNGYARRTWVIVGRLLMVTLFLLAALMGPIHGARAQAYPNKPIRLVINQPPGGATDVAARAVGNKMGTLLGQPVVPDNRPGASGVLGAEVAMKSAPDGYTVLFGNSGAMALVPALDPKVPYDPIKDFIAVGHAVMVDLMMVARRDLASGTLTQAITLARANPAKITFASGGSGTSGHLLIEYLRTMAGANFVHVPHSGDAPALNALMGGHVDYAILSMPGSQAQAKAGTIKPVVVTGKVRARAFPDVPTLAESGHAAFQGGTWGGLHVPAGTPMALVEKLNATLNAALKDPALQEQIYSLGMQPVGGSPREYEEFIVREMQQAAKLMKAVGAKRD